MALVVKSKINFEIKDGSITLFSSGDINKTNQTLNQNFGDDFMVPDGSTDLVISFNSDTQAAQIFLMSDKAVQVKLVSLGNTAGNTSAITLSPDMPSLVSIQNIVGIYVSNSTGAAARVIIEGAGT